MRARVSSWSWCERVSSGSVARLECSILLVIASVLLSASPAHALPEGAAPRVRVLIVGDSQAGAPGAAAQHELERLGYEVRQIHHDGHGAIAYTRRSGGLWREYVRALRAFRPDAVLLVFGHNDRAGERLHAALAQLRDAASPPVWMSGPPHYPDVRDEAEGAAIRGVARDVFGARYIDAWPSTPLELPRDRAGWHLTRDAAGEWGLVMAERIATEGGQSLELARCTYRQTEGGVSASARMGPARSGTTRGSVPPTQTRAHTDLGRLAHLGGADLLPGRRRTSSGTRARPSARRSLRRGRGRCAKDRSRWRARTLATVRRRRTGPRRG